MTFLGLSMFLAFQLSIFDNPLLSTPAYDVPFCSSAELVISNKTVFFEASSHFSFNTPDTIGFIRLADSYETFPIRPTMISYALGCGIQKDNVKLGYRHTFTNSLSSYMSPLVAYSNFDELYLRVEFGTAE